MINSKDFSKLISIAFISQSGSYLLTIALSAFILNTTGSAINAALVFVLSYLPSVFVSARLGAWVDRRISRRLLIKNEFCAILASIACGLCVYFDYPMVLLCTLLAVRSVLMFISRTALSKWVKVITPPHFQTKAIQLFFLTFFMSTATAGILAGIALRQSIVWVMVLDVLTYIAGICVATLLEKQPEGLTSQPRTEQGRVGMLSTLRVIFASPITKLSFLMVCISQSLFKAPILFWFLIYPSRNLDLEWKASVHFRSPLLAESL